MYIDRDYMNGPINNAVHLVPHLEPDGLVIWNYLLNTANWKTVTNDTYKYVFLTSMTGGAPLTATRTATPFCCPMTSHTS